MKAAFDRPVVEGLFMRQGDRIKLLGSHCIGCDADYFPQVAGCANPDCPGGNLTLVELNDRGTLYSFTWQEYQPPSIYRCDDWKPYALGLVELEPGLRVLGRIDLPRDRLTIGMALQLEGRPLFREENGQVVGTYVFSVCGDKK